MDFKTIVAGLMNPTPPEQQAAREALDQGWQAQLAEDYEAAEALYLNAEAQSRTLGDSAAALMARLHRGEVLMRAGQLDDAQAAVEQALDKAQGYTQRAYSFAMIGVLEQARGDWGAARLAYEKALDYARTGGSASAEGRALGHLGDTYLHEGNASYAVHLLRDALPKLNSAGDVELSSYFTGLLSAALIASGQDAEGLHLLGRALRIAEKLGYRLYMRRWALELGDGALAEGRAEDARTLYDQVLRLLKPGAFAPEYVRAASRMSRACLSLRQPDEALRYAQAALDVAEALDDADLRREAQGMLGMALRALERSSEAIPHLQAAAGDGASVDVLRVLAAAQADSGDTDGAVATYERAIRQAEATGTALERARVRRDLGLAHQRRGDLNAAITEWTAALAIYDEQRAYAQAARLHSDIGGARKALGQRMRAIKDYEQALMLLGSLSDGEQETRGLVLSNAANAYAEQGDAESADAFFTDSITIAEQLGDKVAETTRCGNYGWFLLLVGRPRRALAMLERALMISESLGLTLQNAVQQDNLGLVHDALGDYPKALERHRAALARAADPLWRGLIAVNLANTLIALGERDEARTHLDAALAEGGARSHGELMVAALTGLARWHVTGGDAAAAADPLDEAVALARKIDNRRLLAEALNIRSQQQAALDHADAASAAWDEARRLYLMLHMPQGKAQPAWLTPSATRT